MAKQGDKVAARVKTVDGDEQWILAEVVSYSHSTNKSVPPTFCQPIGTHPGGGSRKRGSSQLSIICLHHHRYEVDDIDEEGKE